MSGSRMFSIAALVSVAISAPALAGPGLQVGLSVNPDDFIAGFHFQSHAVSDELDLVPSVEVGVGDVTMIAGNGDLHYVLHTRSDLRPYVGGGLTINWFDFDGGSDTQVGASILGGIQLDPQISLEAKIGLGDVPDWKFVLLFHKP